MQGGSVYVRKRFTGFFTGITQFFIRKKDIDVEEALKMKKHIIWKFDGAEKLSTSKISKEDPLHLSQQILKHIKEKEVLEAHYSPLEVLKKRKVVFVRAFETKTINRLRNEIEKEIQDLISLFTISSTSLVDVNDTSKMTDSEKDRSGGVNSLSIAAGANALYILTKSQESLNPGFDLVSFAEKNLFPIILQKAEYVSTLALSQIIWSFAQLGISEHPILDHMLKIIKTKNLPNSYLYVSNRRWNPNIFIKAQPVYFREKSYTPLGHFLFFEGKKLIHPKNINSHIHI